MARNKWVLAIMLTILMLLLLCACGKSEAVKTAEALILAIGEVTEESGTAIIAAEEAYAELTPDEKENVENYNVLVAARDQYNLIPKPVEKDLYVLVWEDTILGTYEYSNYVYNEKGQVTQYCKGREGKDVQSTFCLEYNQDGTLASETENNSKGYERVNYIYNQDGYVERMYWTSDYSNENGKEFVCDYTFNSKGQIDTKTVVNVNTGYTMEHSYIYDEKGLVIREREHTKNNTFIIEYTYDEYANVIEKHISQLHNAEEGYDAYYKYKCIGTYIAYEINNDTLG